MSNLPIELWTVMIARTFSRSGSRTPSRRSVEDDPAVDVERLPGDVAGAGRGEEHRQRRDVLGLVRTPERNGRVPPSGHLVHGHAFLLGARGQVVVRQRGDGGAGAD